MAVDAARDLQPTGGSYAIESERCYFWEQSAQAEAPPRDAGAQTISLASAGQATAHVPPQLEDRIRSELQSMPQETTPTCC